MSDISFDASSLNSETGGGSPRSVMILMLVLGLLTLAGVGWLRHDSKGLLAVQLPAQSMLLIDGQPVASPLAIQLAPGSHQLEIHLADGRKLNDTVDITANESWLIALDSESHLLKKKLK